MGAVSDSGPILQSLFGSGSMRNAGILTGFTVSAEKKLLLQTVWRWMQSCTNHSLTTAPANRDKYRENSTLGRPRVPSGPLFIGFFLLKLASERHSEQDVIRSDEGSREHYYDLP